MLNMDVHMQSLYGFFAVTLGKAWTNSRVAGETRRLKALVTPP